ncbi:hypothetical protein CBS63078_784 [Aspergillus niger]|nr:hypothetical protein CBS115989_2645 [Aspergillus niger]KAI2831330.1 hypothetical protein CBS133816_2550 [Aspergillus niger]KAI2841268.1 hypothetical protein CBS11350_6436 [Aspergillus niger]KAI2857436.1 hypothetical protein CBS11232_3210 [Aspergillus niger]KAI2865482.1 hypothetical protein CBS12448_2112 [Aspergillus niger]
MSSDIVHLSLNLEIIPNDSSCHEVRSFAHGSSAAWAGSVHLSRARSISRPSTWPPPRANAVHNSGLMYKHRLHAPFPSRVGCASLGQRAYRAARLRSP